MQKLLKETFTEEEKVIVRNNFGLKTLRQIMDLIPRKFNYSTFRTGCQKMNLFRDKSLTRIPTRATFNQSYFKDVNLISCYLAGHCAADGSIMLRDGKYFFALNLKQEDFSLMENYIRELNFKGKIRTFKQKSPHSDYIGTYHSMQLACFDENAMYLEKYYGLKPNKTFRLGPTNLNNEHYNLAFLIGLVDGDGTVCICRSPEYKTLQFSCVSCSKPILEWMKEIIDKKFPKTLGVFNLKPREANLCFKGGIWSFGIAGLRAAVIINYLRQFPVPKLARKWENPEVLAYIEEKKKLRPELFIEPDQAELAALMPKSLPVEVPQNPVLAV